MAKEYGVYQPQKFRHITMIRLNDTVNELKEGPKRIYIAIRDNMSLKLILNVLETLILSIYNKTPQTESLAWGALPQ